LTLVPDPGADPNGQLRQLEGQVGRVDRFYAARDDGGAEVDARGQQQHLEVELITLRSVMLLLSCSRVE
jgi:hypothetical protein